jgi:putative membrane protein
MKLQSLALIFSGTVFFAACGQADNANNDRDNNNATTVDNAMTNDTGATSNITNNSATATVTLDTVDQNFAMKAASGSMAEIQMANMAMQNGTNERVKAFAAMMIRDHGKASEELKAMAPNKGLTMPAQPMPEHMKHMDMLKGKTGAAFDKTYMQHMVMAHQNDIKEFEKASGSAKDADVKGFASRNLPVLRMHLDSAQAISKMKM